MTNTVSTASTAPALTWTTEQRTLIIEHLITIPDGCEPATNGEIELFSAVCRAKGLDPFSGQIYPIFRRDRKHPLGRKMAIQTGIDGYNLIAARTGKLDGIHTEWCGQDAQWCDVWLANEPPAAARCIITLRGSTSPIIAVATWQELCPRDQNGTIQNVQWIRMPSAMLGKCARAAALRTAFPNETSGLQVDAEMHQADIVDVIREPLPGLPMPRRRADANDRQRIKDASTGLTASERDAVIAPYAEDGKLYGDRVPDVLEALRIVGLVEIEEMMVEAEAVESDLEVEA